MIGTALIFLAVFGIVVVLALKYPGYGFIAGLTLFFNIGGYIPPRAFGMPGFFTLLDLGLIFAFALGLADRIVKKRTYIDNALGRLLLICLVFSFYQLAVTIWIKLQIVSPVALVREIVIHKWRIFGIYFSIPTYYIIQRYSREVFRVIIWVTGIVLAAFFLTLLTPLDLIRVVSFERDLGATVQRTTIYNYGYMMMSIPLALSSLLLKVRIRAKRVLLFCGMGMLITILITLTRITIITMAGMVFLSFFLVKNLFKLKFSNIMRRSLAFLMVVFVVLMLASGVFSSLYNVFKLTAYEALGKVPPGTTQGRGQFEVAVMLPLFKENMLTGTGYLSDYFSSYHTRYELGLADMPILGNLAIYGLVGFLIYLGRYLVVHKTILSFVRKFRPDTLFTVLTNYDVLLLLWAIIYFYALVFFRLFMFSIDLVYDWEAVGMGFLIGVLYGLLRKYRRLDVPGENSPLSASLPAVAESRKTR